MTAGADSSLGIILRGAGQRLCREDRGEPWEAPPPPPHTHRPAPRTSPSPRERETRFVDEDTHTHGIEALSEEDHPREIWKRLSTGGVTPTLFPFFFLFFSLFFFFIITKDSPLFFIRETQRGAGSGYIHPNWRGTGRDPSPRMPAGPDDPATVASVEEFLSAMSDIPAVAMDQDTAELTLSDIVETLSTHAEDGDWGWVVYFCRAGGLASTFSIFEDAGGNDQQYGILVRGVLAFEAAQVALGDKRALDVVANSPLIVRLFVLKFESMPQKVVCAALRTLAVIALHNMKGHINVITSIHGRDPSSESDKRKSLSGSPRWEALIDALARPKSLTILKRDVLALLNVLISAGPTIDQRMELRNVLKRLGFKARLRICSAGPILVGAMQVASLTRVWMTAKWLQVSTKFIRSNCVLRLGFTFVRSRRMCKFSGACVATQAFRCCGIRAIKLWEKTVMITKRRQPGSAKT